MGLPCFASGRLICLNPYLNGTFVQGARKTGETTLLPTQAMFRTHLVGVIVDTPNKEDG